jgi:hypothetical protein
MAALEFLCRSGRHPVLSLARATDDLAPAAAVDRDSPGRRGPGRRGDDRRPATPGGDRRLPGRAAYSVVPGGVIEESAKAQASIFVVVLLMLFLMMTILMVQLMSFQRLFLVLLTAPLALIGVAGALLASHTPMDFVAILGVIPLIGMVIRNPVILIAQIDEITAGTRRAGCRARCTGG